MMTFKNTQEVFEQALQEGRLTRDKAKSNFVARFMYMGTDESGKDLFKNILYRYYIQ